MSTVEPDEEVLESIAQSRGRESHKQRPDDKTHSSLIIPVRLILILHTRLLLLRVWTKVGTRAQTAFVLNPT